MNDDEEGSPTWGWARCAAQGLFWGAVVVLAFPLLALFRADERIEYADDLRAADPSLFE